jgi:SAM-dependent methyltransferase
MFFAQRIRSIPAGAKVLEIGPGSTPFAGATHYLELRMDTEEERIRQRGNVATVPRFGDKPLAFYDGGRFPFEDDAFDYVIASHVIEHVESPELFMREVFRVGCGRGYLEFPRITYEYMFDFDVHRHIISYDTAERLLSYVPKTELPFKAFEPVTAQLRPMLENNWMDVIKLNPDYFFQGFEFDAPFDIQRVNSLAGLSAGTSQLARRSRWAAGIAQLLTRVL